MAVIDNGTLDIPVGISLNGDVGIFPTLVDPSSSGLDLPVGSLALQTDGTLWKKTGAATTGWEDVSNEGTGGFNPGRTVMVAKSGSSYSTIAAGITAANALTPTGTAPVTILVYPGLYSEDSLTLPAYCNLVGIGKIGSVIINATSTSATILTASGAQEIAGLVFSNTSAGDGVGVTTSAASTLIRDCVFQNCRGAVVVTGSSAVGCVVQNCIINYSISDNAGTGVLITGGAEAIVQSVSVRGTGGSLDPYFGISVQAASKVTVSSCLVRYSYIGYHCNGASFMYVSGSAAENCTTGYRAASADTTLQVNAGSIRDCTTDISIGNAAVTGYYAGSAELEKVDFGGATDFFLNITQFTKGDEGQKIVGELAVGRWDRPSETCLGAGDSTVDAMYVFSNTNGTVGTWLDNTEDASSKTGSTFSPFAGTAAGNCFYVGNTERIFPGIKLEDITPALVIGTGSLILEYYNGTAWVELYGMEADSDYPHDSRARKYFQATGNVQIRVNDQDDWAKNTLNGVNAYWMRWRIVTAITTAPVAERCKCHTNRYEINKTGFSEKFGLAQGTRDISLSLMTDIQGFNSSNVPLNANSNTYLVVENNDRDNNRKDGSGGTFRVPRGLNTAYPITFHILFANLSTNSGDVENEVYLAKVGPGTVLDGTVPEIGPVGGIATVDATADKVYKTEHELFIPDSLPEETFIWGLIRDATAGNLDDTLSGATYIVGWAATGVFWQ